MSALSEGMVLADKSQLDQGTLLKILGLGALSSPMVNGKGATILKDNFAPNFPLKHQENVSTVFSWVKIVFDINLNTNQQKDLRLGLELAQSLGEDLPTIAASNEIYKKALSQGHGDEDMCAVYKAVSKSQ